MSGLFGGSSPNLVKKWNLSSFVSEDSPRLSTKSNTTPSSLPELNLSDVSKNIKQINLTMSKLSMEYDKLFRKFGLKSADLKKYIKTLIERDDIGETLSALENADINIIVNQMRILDAKAKLESDRFKQIRDEKKTQLDILKASGQAIGDTGVAVVQQNNSPTAISSLAKSVNNDSAIDLGTINVASLPVIDTVSKINTPAIEVKEPVPNVLEELASNKVQMEPARVDTNPTLPSQTVEVKSEIIPEPVAPSLSTMSRLKDQIVSSDILGTNVTTLHDVNKSNIDIIKERLMNKQDLLESGDTMLGHDLKKSLTGIRQRNTKHTRVLYVNVNNGTYYTKGFYVDDNGNPTTELPRDYFIEYSIIHLGDLEFDIVNKQVTTYYEDEPIPYVLVNNDSGMSQFYIDEWNNPKTDRFRLDEEVLLKLRAQYNQ